MEILKIGIGLILLAIGICILVFGVQLFLVKPKVWKENRTAIADPTNPAHRHLIKTELTVDIRDGSLHSSHKLSDEAINRNE